MYTKLNAIKNARALDMYDSVFVQRYAFLMDNGLLLLSDGIQRVPPNYQMYSKDEIGLFFMK